MRQFLIVAVLLASMLALGFGMLFRNLELGIIRENSQQHQVPLAIPAPAPAIAETAPRVLVDDSIVTALREENAELRARIQRLEKQEPRTRGELAAIVGAKESEVDYLLDRSELIPDARQLCDAIRVSGAQSVWLALQAESALYRSFAKFKAENPVGDDRMTWHHARWAPFLERSITATCDQLYRLNLPSTVVEPFRTKMMEGI